MRGHRGSRPPSSPSGPSAAHPVRWPLNGHAGRVALGDPHRVAVRFRRSAYWAVVRSILRGPEPPIRIGSRGCTGAGRRRRRASRRSGRRGSPARRRAGADEPDRLVQAIQPLAEARPEVEPERLVLALEPTGAEAEDGASLHYRWSSMVASLADAPGCGRCWPRPRAPAGRASSAASRPPGQPALELRVRPSPSSASRWSSALSESKPAASTRRAASRRAARSSSRSRRRPRSASTEHIGTSKSAHGANSSLTGEAAHDAWHRPIATIAAGASQCVDTRHPRLLPSATRS